MDGATHPGDGQSRKNKPLYSVNLSRFGILAPFKCLPEAPFRDSRFPLWVLSEELSTVFLFSAETTKT